MAGGADGRIPQQMLEAIKTAAVEVGAKNLLLASSLTHLLAAFQAQRLPCIPLRGLTLAVQLYGTPLARPMGDIDLLIHQRDVSGIQRLLDELGYRPIDRRAGFAERFSYQLEYVTRRPPPVIVEPRWTIAYPPFVEPFDMEAVWRRCVPSRFRDLPILSLSAEDLVIHLCFHLSHHGRSSPLLWTYELDRLLRNRVARMDWEVFVRITQQAGCGPLVAGILRNTQRQWDTPVPGWVLERLDASAPAKRPLAHTLVERSQVPGRESLAALLALHGFTAKWRYAWTLLVPSPEFMMAHYGLTARWQLVGWYPRRVVWLFTAAVKSLLQALVPHSRLGRYWSSIRRQPLPVLLRKLRHPLVWPIDLGPPEQLLAQTAAKYNDPAEVARASSLVQEGLDEAERALVNGPMAIRGLVLDAGCGAGREAIALARLGYRVIGIDIARNAIKAARRHAQAVGLDITFLDMAAHDVSPGLGPFDYILATNGFYSNLPGRALRIRTLHTLARVLKPGGALFLGALLAPVYRPGPRVDLVDGLRRLRRLIPGRTGTAEPGDRLEGTERPDTVPVFVHVFANPRHIEEESRRAGFVCRRIQEATWELRH